MHLPSERLVRHWEPCSRWQRASATQHPAEEAAAEVSGEEKQPLGLRGERVARSGSWERAGERLENTALRCRGAQSDRFSLPLGDLGISLRSVFVPRWVGEPK